jgi:hypothetical protein
MVMASDKTLVETLLETAKQRVEQARAHRPGTAGDVAADIAVELDVLLCARRRLLAVTESPGAYDMFFAAVAAAMRANDEAALAVLDERIQLLEAASAPTVAIATNRVQALVEFELPGAPSSSSPESLLDRIRQALPSWATVTALHLVNRPTGETR